jgi:GTP pyrophosphokinase
MEPKSLVRRASTGDLIIEGEGNLLFKMAGCCRPIIGDVVGGYITQGRGVSVHREDCKSFAYLKETHPERIMSVSWGESSKTQYLVDLHIEALDRPGLLKDVTQVLLGEKLSILGLRSAVDADGVARLFLSFSIQEKSQLDRVMHLLRRVPKVLEVRR